MLQKHSGGRRGSVLLLLRSPAAARIIGFSTAQRSDALCDDDAICAAGPAAAGGSAAAGPVTLGGARAVGWVKHVCAPLHLKAGVRLSKGRGGGGAHAARCHAIVGEERARSAGRDKIMHLRWRKHKPPPPPLVAAVTAFVGA